MGGSEGDRIKLNMKIATWEMRVPNSDAPYRNSTIQNTCPPKTAFKKYITIITWYYCDSIRTWRLILLLRHPDFKTMPEFQTVRLKGSLHRAQFLLPYPKYGFLRFHISKFDRASTIDGYCRLRQQERISECLTRSEVFWAWISPARLNSGQDLTRSWSSGTSLHSLISFHEFSYTQKSLLKITK